MSHENLVAGDTEKAAAKIAAFQQFGLDSLHLVLDFDRTITVGQPGHDDATSWQVLYQHLPAEAQQQYDDYYQHYRTLEVSGSMTVEESAAWSSAVLDLYVAHGVNLYEIEKDFLKVVALRPEAESLFAFCKAQGIPLVILSAGVKNVIDIMLAKYGLESTVTLGIELDMDNTGAITGWDRDSLIHVFNKKEAGRAELEAIRHQRPNCILVGDSIVDAAMVAGNEQVIRVRIVDPRSDETQDPAAIAAETFKHFDFMDNSRSLLPVLRLLKTIATPVALP